MNQKERMLAGLPYRAWMDGLSEERLENKKRIFRFNQLPPEAEKEQNELIKEILGKTGERIHIEAPFRCDYGYNIEVGENFFGKISTLFSTFIQQHKGTDYFVEFLLSVWRTYPTDCFFGARSIPVTEKLFHTNLDSLLLL